MKIIDVNEQNKPKYFLCLEDWSSEMKESGNRKSLWFDQMKNNGLRVKLAVDDTDAVVGMIQYAPIEYSHISGEELFFIYCIWVHGHKPGIGNQQKKGFGSLLLKTAEEDARTSGAKGIAAWGLSLPFWMKASWFKKYGFIKADKDGITVLLWKPFAKDANAPKWITQKKNPEKIPGKVTVTSFVNGWCPAQNIAYERAKRASDEFGDKVTFNEINTFDRKNLFEWGIVDGLFIDDKQIQTGPPPSYEKIKEMIAKRVKKLR